MDNKDICGYTMDKLKDAMEKIGEKPFRAKQIYTWLHKRQVWDFEEMTDLSKPLRMKLSENFKIPYGEVIEKLTATDGTSKYLFKFRNNSIIESVLMKHKFGNSVCVSSQVGCSMGCSFCYSTKDGKERDLTASEMLYQVYKIQKDLGGRISNVVIMGSGEPLENYDNTMDFIEILCSEEGNDLGGRHITLSTCGLADKIYDLAKKKLQINLAVSLHASNDEIRKELMPIARAYSIKEVLAACEHYAKETGRRVTYEYALMKGINDGLDNARELALKLKGTLCHVNLIPVNEIKDGQFKKPDSKRINEFSTILNGSGVVTTIRREMGSSISAACGQLRGRRKAEESKAE